MNIGHGIAIAGIWLGCGLVAYAAPDAAIIAVMMAVPATLFVVRG